MSYKSFASQGSFSDNQLRAPDESQKIRSQAARRVQGMNTAQAFLEKNESIYLQAQQQAQQQERMQREDNYKLETQNRQAYIDAVTRDYNIELQNDKNKAQSSLNLLRDLSAFSKSAFDTYSAIQEQERKKEAGTAFGVIIQAGLNYKDLQAVLSLSDNLTQAELFQQDAVRETFGEVKDPAVRNAIYQVYQNRNTRAWIENKAVYQNTLQLYPEFVQEELKKLPQDAPASQQLAILDSSLANFVATHFEGARPEVIGVSVIPGLRGLQNNIRESLQSRIKSQQEARLEFDTMQALNIAYADKGAAGVMKWFTTTPRGPEKRKVAAKWIVNSLKSGGPNALNAQEALDILNYQYEFNGKLTSWSQQFTGTDEVADVNVAVREYRDREAAAYRQSVNDRKRDNEQSIREKYDELNEDGFYTSQEHRRLQEYAEQIGGIGYDSEFVKSAAKTTLEQRAAPLAQKMLDNRLASGTLTVKYVQSMKLTRQLHATYMALAEQQERMLEDPEVASAIKQVRASVLNNDAIAVAYQMKKNVATVTGMQDKLVREFKQNLIASNGNIQQALAANNARVSSLLSNPANYDKNGNFNEIVSELQSNASDAAKSITTFNNVTQALLNPKALTNAETITNAMSPEMIADISEYIDKFGDPGIKQPAIIRYIGESLNLDPLGALNYIAPAIGKEPVRFENNTLQALKNSLPPKFIRAANTYRTNERVNRATLAMTDGANTADLRGAFGAQVVMSDKAVPGARTLVGMGVPPRAAATMSGSIEQESTWQGQRNWGEVQNDGSVKNYGLLSWAEFQGDRTRVARIEGYLGKEIDQASDEEQLAAILREMKEVYPATYQVIMDPNSSQPELNKAMKDYVGYGIAGNRYRFTNRIYSQIK
tara:strand:- start:5283 stop:7931 length:2649 start_codon:yes stop_codon:yes gene_type:complete